MNEKTGLKQNRNVTLDYLRVFAMFMVMLDHIAFMRRPEWIGTKLADYAFFKPLSIIQWSGVFGVCIFFFNSWFWNKVREFLISTW